MAGVISSQQQAAEPTPTRASKRASRTRSRLLQAAREMFNRKGVAGTTIGEITELADLGKGTFYRHFATKEEAVIALVEEVVDRLISQVREAMGQPDSPAEAVHRLLMAHWDFFLNRQAEFVLLFQPRLLLRLQQDAGEDLEPPYRRYLEAMDLELSRFVGAGVDPPKVRRLVCATAGFVSGFLSFGMIGLSSEEIRRSLQALREAFVAASLAYLTSGPEPAVTKAAG